MGTNRVLLRRVPALPDVLYQDTIYLVQDGADKCTIVVTNNAAIPTAYTAAGANGDDGWSPVFAVASDGERRVLEVTDWAGGTGTKPATGKYVGETGLVDAVGDGVDVRGAEGEDGDDGDAATIAIDSVDTLDAGESATVENVGTSSAASFKFGIPKGAAGADGTNFNPDAKGPFSGRTEHDGEAEGYSYLSTDGDGDGGTDPVYFFKASATSGDWGPAIPFAGGVSSYNDLTDKPTLESFTYELDDDNAVERTVVEFISEGRINIHDLGVTGDGSTDDTAKIQSAFEQGGFLLIPDGDFYIAPAGADAGGVLATLTKNIDILCSPKARFFSDGLDNDLIRFGVPSGGTGLPTGGVTFAWKGGYFDLTGVKNSTSMPHTDTYPGANVGSSASTCALFVDGAYSADGTVKNGFRLAKIKDAIVVAGDHWETAGGDSGIFCGSGSDLTFVEDCYFQGTRDSAVYASREGTGIAGGPVHIRNNKMVNCIFGANVKRALAGATIKGNTAINCLEAWGFENAAGGRIIGGEISDNYEYQCTRQVRLQYCTGVDVKLNAMENMGAVLSDGETPVSIYGIASGALTLEGAQYCKIKGARIISVNSNWSGTDQYVFYVAGFDPGTGVEKSSHNRIYDMLALSGSGVHGLGYEKSGETEYNIYRDCLAEGATLPNLSNIDTTSVEERLSTAGNRIFRNPIYVNDGSAAAPFLARFGQTSTGIFGATNKIGLSAAGTERVSATSRGVFMGLQTFADDAAAATGGLSTGDIYKTSTGEVRIKI